MNTKAQKKFDEIWLTVQRVGNLRNQLADKALSNGILELLYSGHHQYLLSPAIKQSKFDTERLAAQLKEQEQILWNNLVILTGVE